MSNPYKIKTHKRIYRKSWSSIAVRTLLILISGSVLFGLGWFLYEPASALFGNGLVSKEVTQPVVDAQVPTEDTAPPMEVPPEPQAEQTSPQAVQQEEQRENHPAGSKQKQQEEPQMSSEDALKILSVVPQSVLGDPSGRTTASITPQRIAAFSQNVILDPASFAKRLDEAKKAGMQAALVEIKAESGLVSYPIQYLEGKDAQYTVPNPVSLQKLVAQIREAGLVPMAAIHTFQDSKFQLGEWDAAIHYKNSKMLWLDNAPAEGGKSWLNPYSTQAKEYIAKIMQDAAAAGFEEIVLQSFQFPVGFALDKMDFGQTNGQSKQDCLKGLSQRYRQQAQELGVSLRIEYPAASMMGASSVAYGADSTLLIDGPSVVDCSLSQFMERFDTDQLKLENPQSDPVASYQLIAQAGQGKGENLVARISVNGLLHEQQQEIIDNLLKSGYRGVIVPYA